MPSPSMRQPWSDGRLRASRVDGTINICRAPFHGIHFLHQFAGRKVHPEPARCCIGVVVPSMVLHNALSVIAFADQKIRRKFRIVRTCVDLTNWVHSYTTLEVRWQCRIGRTMTDLWRMFVRDDLLTTTFASAKFLTGIRPTEKLACCRRLVWRMIICAVVGLPPVDR